MLKPETIRYVAQKVADHFELLLATTEITDTGNLLVEYKNRKYPSAWGNAIFFPQWEDMDSVQLAIELTQCIVDMLHDDVYQIAIANAECAEWEASQLERQRD